MLLLNANRVTSTDRLIDGLWDDPPPLAKLDNMINSMRKRIGAGGSIVTRPCGYELRLGAHRLDVLEFRRLTELCRQAAAQGDPALAVVRLSRAASLWRGPALADVAHPYRERLYERQLIALACSGRRVEAMQVPCSDCGATWRRQDECAHDARSGVRRGPRC